MHMVLVLVVKWNRTEATSERRPRRKDARFGRGRSVASFGLRPLVRCNTYVWCGSVSPEHVATYRVYMYVPAGVLAS
jgi:hypothetical protein